MTVRKTAVCNGMDTDQLHGLAAAVRTRPEASTVVVRTVHRWDDGFGVDSSISSVEEGGQVMPGHHTFRTDWPEPFGRDTGPTPGGESLLAAIGASVATTFVLQASIRGIAIDELEVDVEGRIDLQGLLEVGKVRSGLTDVSIVLRVHSAADDRTLEELARSVSGSSPAFDTLVNPVPAQLSVQRVS